MLQVHGQNLFVVWPPTPKNLQWFGSHSGITHFSIFEQALDKLENPYCLILKQGQHATLGPGYIHGVLSATNSAVAGIPFVHPDLLEEAKHVLQWESKLAEARNKGIPKTRRTVEDIVNGIGCNKNLWGELGEQMLDISTAFYQ